MSAPKPPTNMTPERTAVLALAMPLVQALAAEISKLPPACSGAGSKRSWPQCVTKKRSTKLPIIEIRYPLM